MALRDEDLQRHPLPGEQVRCACRRCGAHLTAVALGGGSLSGSCAICLSQDFRPVAERAGT